MRRHSNKNIFYATSTLVGTIVGVGMFGLPYVASQAGFSVGVFFLLALGGITILVHLLYGEVVLRSREPHRLVGFAKLYLGAGASRIAAFSNVVGFYGAILAYMIVGGSFLHILFGKFSGVSRDEWVFLFYLVGVMFVFFHVRSVAKVEFYLSLFLIGVVLFLFAKSIPFIQANNFSSMSWDPRLFFLPYGVVLFSLAGAAAIPELKDILGGKELRHLKPAILMGTAVPLFLYILFMFSVVGVIGSATHREAIPGLEGVLGEGVLILGSLFGVVAVFTSLLVIGLNLKEIFWYDYHVPKHAAWFLVVIVPLVLYTAGFKNFIETIGFVGAIMGGIDGILIILIHTAAKKRGERTPEYEITFPLLVSFFLMGVFILGIIWEISYLFILF